MKYKSMPFKKKKYVVHKPELKKNEGTRSQAISGI
jgi:hypothetical protein